MNITLPALLALALSLSVQVAMSADVEGMSIYGEQEMPHVATDIAWTDIDVGSLQNESVPDIIRSVFESANQLVCDKIISTGLPAGGHTGFDRLIQVYRESEQINRKNVGSR